MLPAVLCWLALLSPLKWEWDDQHSWHCAPWLPPSAWPGCLRAIKVVPRPHCVGHSPARGRRGQGSDTETWQLQDLYLVLQKKKDIYTFILCCTSFKAGLITWAFLMGWQKQMLPGSEIVANVLSRWLERLVQGYSLNPGMISIFSIFRSKASVKLTFYWCQKMQKTFNAATNDKETSWWCSL